MPVSIGPEDSVRLTVALSVHHADNGVFTQFFLSLGWATCAIEELDDPLPAGEHEVDVDGTARGGR